MNYHAFFLPFLFYERIIGKLFLLVLTKLFFMNIKWVVIISFIFLFICLTCVDAADNVTDDNITQSDVICQPPDISDDINVTFNETMWEENLSDIDVELPENASGDFCIKINDEAIYNNTITNHSFKVPIKLPKPKFVLIEYVSSKGYENL